MDLDALLTITKAIGVAERVGEAMELVVDLYLDD